jgi:hypothetical protein
MPPHVSKAIVSQIAPIFLRVYIFSILYVMTLAREGTGEGHKTFRSMVKNGRRACDFLQRT